MTATHRAPSRPLRDLILSLASSYQGKRARRMFARSNYPVSLDICSDCNLRINGIDPGTPLPPAYTRNTAQYAQIVSSTDSISEHDSGMHDDGLCHLCEDPNIPGEWFDAIARRLPR